MTKNITLGAITALLLGTTAAIAADLPMKAVPPPVQIYDWTGFYIGVSAGGSLGGSDHVDRLLASATPSGYNVKGGLVGGTIGYNWQMSNFVLGFEGDVSWVAEYGIIPDVGVVAQNNGFVDEPADPLFRASPRRRGWRPRASASAMPSTTCCSTEPAAMPVQASDRAYMTTLITLLVSSSSTRSGWTAGGGLEWGFAPNWSAKFEWLYMKFDTVALNTAFAEGPRTVPFDDNVIRFGINYRFGGGPGGRKILIAADTLKSKSSGHGRSFASQEKLSGTGAFLPAPLSSYRRRIVGSLETVLPG